MQVYRKREKLFVYKYLLLILVNFGNCQLRSIFLPSPSPQVLPATVEATSEIRTPASVNSLVIIIPSPVPDQASLNSNFIPNEEKVDTSKVSYAEASIEQSQAIPIDPIFTEQVTPIQPVFDGQSVTAVQPVFAQQPPPDEVVFQEQPSPVQTYSQGQFQSSDIDVDVCNDTILSILERLEEARLFREALQAAGFEGIFNDSSLIATAFVPIDRGFQSLLDQLALPFTELSSRLDVLIPILQMHVVPNQGILLQDIAVGDTFTTLLGQQIEVGIDETGSVPSIIPPLRAVPGVVVGGDLQACSAVVHLVDNVIVPDLSEVLEINL